MNKQMEKRIGALQFPPADRLPIRGNFDSICVPNRGVGKRKLQDVMRRRWRSFHKYCARAVPVEVVIGIVKKCRVQI